MSSALPTVIFGLVASLCWGSGDFSGGLASRRANPSAVIIAAYAAGFVLLIALALIGREQLPSPLDIMWGGLAGLVGAIGLAAFYQALASGRMGIAAPVSAVMTATLPVLFNVFIAGLPGWFQIAGFLIALLAIALISRPEGTKGRPEGIGLALLAGCGFGTFFILISRVNHDSTFWPLAMARFTSVLFLLIVVRMRRQQMLPKRSLVPLVLLAGILDALGNTFFVLAAHAGRLDVAAVLASLYPAATVLLAAIFLRERLTRIQAAGVLLALLAVPLISV
jgi:drug/metabolite transporter (DMT)-like permease